MCYRRGCLAGKAIQMCHWCSCLAWLLGGKGDGDVLPAWMLGGDGGREVLLV